MTDKQLKFCLEYLVDLNATAAAKRAGYSEKTAASIGQENLIKPEIQEEIQRQQDKRSNRTQITADIVLQELAKIGFSDVTDYVTVEEKGIKFKQIDPLKSGAISEISSSETQFGTNIKFKLYDKLNALDKIARHLGGFYKDKEEEQAPDRVVKIVFGDLDKI